MAFYGKGKNVLCAFRSQLNETRLLDGKSFMSMFVITGSIMYVICDYWGTVLYEIAVYIFTNYNQFYHSLMGTSINKFSN